MTASGAGSPVLLLGAAGQLGRDLARTFAGPALAALTREDLDVTNAAAVRRAVERIAPALVLNATADNRVDRTEGDPGPAFAVNAVAVHHLAQACTRAGARLVHFSTGYVFGAHGDGPFAEEACPAPVSAYGVSKLAGERLVQAAGPDHLAIRTSGLYGAAGSRAKPDGHFVGTMLRLAREGRAIRVVADQVLTPTYTADLADGLRRLLDARPPGGIYHITNAGACSWFEFARAIFELAGVAAVLEPTTSAAYAAAARRPANAVLRDTRLAALGVAPLRPWRDALRAYLATRGEPPSPLL